MTKASYAEAGRIFLEYATRFAPTMPAYLTRNDKPEILRLLKRYREHCHKLDTALREVGWTYDEWRNHEPTPQEREAYDHEIFQKWPESGN